MNEFIIRSLQNRATGEEADDLRRWRAASAENERQYHILEELWRVMDAAGGVPMPGVGTSAMPDPEMLIAEAEGQERDAVPRSWTRHVRTAAVAAAIAAVGFGLGWFAEHRSSVGGAMAQSEVKTGAGEMTTVTLADGTSVRLGPRSRLRLAYDAKNRRAWLEGRAFFGVQTDPSRPFTVQTRYGEAVVHGTRFEVRSEDEEFRVLVVDGKVSVSAGGVAAELGEGEMSRSPGGAPPSTSKVEDAFALLDWMGSTLVFHRTPLNQAIREIERRYGVTVVLEDPRLGELEVTVTFTDQVLEEVVLVLCEIIGGRCSVDQDRVRISKGPPVGAEVRIG